MYLHIISTGKLRDSNLQALEAEYLKRLPGHWKIRVIETPTAPTPEKEAALQLNALGKLPAGTQVVLLDEHGPNPTSPQLAAKLEHWQQAGSLAFLIGGAAGFDGAFKKQYPVHLSFGKMTFPHQMMRLLLIEQLYRAVCINSGHPYHRDNPNA